MHPVSGSGSVIQAIGQISRGALFSVAGLTDNAAPMKVEFLVDIVSRDLPVGCALRDALGGEAVTLSSTFFSDIDGRATLPASRRLGADVLITPW